MTPVLDGLKSYDQARHDLAMFLNLESVRFGKAGLEIIVDWKRLLYFGNFSSYYHEGQKKES